VPNRTKCIPLERMGARQFLQGEGGFGWQLPFLLVGLLTLRCEPTIDRIELVLFSLQNRRFVPTWQT
jgi:hypothetical protein